MTASDNNPLEELYRRPGFMIRRVHQIAVSLFIEETGKLGVTNRQYGILFVLKHRPGVDQISVANLLGLDRSTTGMVLKKLEDDGLVARSIDARDRRRHSLRLTKSGERLLSRLAEPARKARARVLSAFTPSERTLFLQLLDKFTRAFNGSTRVPLDPDRGHNEKAPVGAGRSRIVRMRKTRERATPGL
ncbi:MAG TPA: MarR family transcriptional regulator [Xanthobacteraceae bacterium]|nr:MarR family transcriptional regulator [Xanthobacteraceae bacterium]